ncbi:efflux RND transporter permease subunit [uncultured Helicobacter sp.]|uniref:efflux RND transporter permease subunit n=1 Tax=uncultured Helicobacter sp. TaxID=175537 RepID=UPI00374F5E5B
MIRTLKFCLHNPMVVLVCVIFAVMFGILGLKSMPYQLMPQVSKPTISVYTSWNGATPYEVEKEIINRQEKYLKGIEGLESISSTARQGRAVVGLEFQSGVDINFALLKVSAKMDEIKGYPDDVDKPTIAMSGESIPPAIYLFLRTLEGNDREVDTYKTFFEDYVLGHLERIEGVGEVFYPGGRATQMQILLDSKQLAHHNIAIADVITAIITHNKNTTAGSLDYGMRSYKIKVASEYDNATSILHTPIQKSGNKIIYLQDLALVIEGFAKQASYGYLNDTRALSVQIVPTATANILELTQKTRAIVQNLNEGILHDNGLEFVWSRDQEGYILDALHLVKDNIIMGMILACVVLYLFLRNVYSMAVVLIVIPICIIAAFFFLNLMGRTLNVISLAGVSFAMSMLIDNAIVVLENITRHLHMQKPLLRACIDGTREVIGAIFASVVTTIAIFIPIMDMQEDLGQLFYDIALSVCFGLGISFFASIFVIPTMLYVCMGRFSFESNHTMSWYQKLGIAFSDWLMRVLDSLLRTPKRSAWFIAGFMVFCVISSWVLFPRLDYLPKGNQNFLIAYINAPPGISYEQRKEIGESIFAQNAHLIESLGYTQRDSTDLPPIAHLFFSGSESYMQVGVTSSNPAEIRRLIPQIQESIRNIPGVQASVVQQGIFDKGSSTQSIYINIVGSELDSLISTATALSNAIKQKMPYMQVRPLPALENTNREIVLYPDYVALALNDLNAKSFGDIVDVVLDGKQIDEFKTPSGKTIDLVLKALPDLSEESIERAKESLDSQAPEDFAHTQIYTPSGKLLPLSSLTRIEQEYTMAQIRHFERERTILLVLNSPADKPLEEVLSHIKDEVIPEIESKGEMRDNHLIFGGSAKDMQGGREDLYAGFALALFITYLILCALYGNFSYPFIIILTVPFAISGGLFGLSFVNAFLYPQNLDMLSLLGFIILVGSVVNNAILIVYQTQFNLSYGMAYLPSIIESTKSRVRPIFMSIFTSVFGLLPMVLFGGAGSEIYRGLGAVLVGGLLFSGVLSLLVIPSALLLYFWAKEHRKDLQEKCYNTITRARRKVAEILARVGRRLWVWIGRIVQHLRRWRHAK